MESRMTAKVAEDGVEGLSKKEKGLMNMDNLVVIAVEDRNVRGLNGNGKKTINN